MISIDPEIKQVPLSSLLGEGQDELAYTLEANGSGFVYLRPGHDNYTILWPTSRRPDDLQKPLAKFLLGNYIRQGQATFFSKGQYESVDLDRFMENQGELPLRYLLLENCEAADLTINGKDLNMSWSKAIGRPNRLTVLYEGERDIGYSIGLLVSRTVDLVIPKDKIEEVAASVEYLIQSVVTNQLVH